MTSEIAGSTSTVLEEYARAGSARRGFWRVVVTVLLLGTSIFAIATAVIITAVVWNRAAEGARPLDSSADITRLIAEGGPIGVAVNLGAIALLWPSLWVALRLLHKQSLRTLFSPEGLIRWHEFRRGAILIAGVLLMASLITLPAGDLPGRSALPLVKWALIVVPMAALVFVQATAEELVFRGYLLQQFALRTRNPLIWAGVPSLLFSLLHYNPALPDLERYLYVLATFMYGLLASATVARTGSLATAMGIHVTTNILAVTLVAGEGLLDGAALFVQTGGTTTVDLLVNIAAITALLAWVLSPVSPIRPRPRA